MTRRLVCKQVSMMQSLYVLGKARIKKDKKNAACHIKTGYLSVECITGYSVQVCMKQQRK